MRDGVRFVKKSAGNLAMCESDADFPKLGSHPCGEDTEFALFSAHAERVELGLFDQDGQLTACFDLPGRSGDIWHGRVAGCGSGQRYAYRVRGPAGPPHAFDPRDWLLDPYALAWTHGLAGGRTPLSVVRGWPKPRTMRRPSMPWAQTIIYESHLKGLTAQHPNLPAALRGTYAAIAEPCIIEHLKGLGITAVEFLPLQAFADEPRLRRMGLSNYWGYNPVGFFVPEPRYAAGSDPIDDPMAELMAAIDALHGAGIEAILDVVFNHTGEGDVHGPNLSFRRIDNASYYKHEAEGGYVNDTGCGNTLDFAHPFVQRLAMDSLRYWAEVIGFDGFRFDLAVTCGRDGRAFDPGAAFLDCLRQDPVLTKCKLIAEPWDVGPEGYRLGAFGHPFAEWNDRFRDGVRRFWRGDHDSLPNLAAALAGSASVFDGQGRRSWASMNFISSHDGFTGADLVSHADKHNHANGENNADGHNQNFSQNHGVEGPTDDPAIVTARLQSLKNMLATLLLAQGTPMLLAGDELGNSQQGNNNAYCQDNPLGWVDWPTARHELTDFIARLARLRRERPELRQASFLHGEPVVADCGARLNINWRHASGSAMSEADWHDPENMAVWLEVAGGNGTTAILINGTTRNRHFALKGGNLLLATAAVQPLSIGIEVPGRCLAVFSLD